MSRVDVILDRLQKVRKHGNKWMACCPAHDDRSPSLAIAEDNDKVLIHCFAGCDIGDVMAAINLSVTDLYPEYNQHSLHSDTPNYIARKGREILQKQEHDLEVMKRTLEWYQRDVKNGVKFPESENAKYRELYKKIKSLEAA